MGGKIFLSYRRSDARADARSIYQRLQRDFGTRRLFIDIDTIEKGHDFRIALDEALTSTSVMLVLVGKDWLDTRDDQGRRRLDDPSDFVRIEVTRAFELELTVVPVLIDGAEIPRTDQLPDDIKDLASRQALRLSHDNFARDMDGLADVIAQHVRRSRHSTFGIAAAVLIAILAAGTYWTVFTPRPPTANILQRNTVIIDKEIFIELVKAYNSKINEKGSVSQGQERNKLAKLLKMKTTNPDRAYAEFVTRIKSLLKRLDELRSVLGGQLVAEAKAQSRAGNLKQARIALRNLLERHRIGKVPADDLSTFADTLAQAYLSMGNLSNAIEVYEEVIAVTNPPGHFTRSYAETLLAAGRYQLAISILDTALAPKKDMPKFETVDLAWLNDALAQAYENIGDLPTAQRRFTIAYGLMKTAVREGKATAGDLASILNDMTSVSLQKNDLGAARTSLCKSIRISLNSRGNKDRKTLIARLNLVGLSRRMGLIGAGRKQLQDVGKDIRSTTTKNDPLRGIVQIHKALLAITDHRHQDAMEAIGQAEVFFRKLASKGRGFHQRMARIKQIEQIALFKLQQPQKSFEAGEISRELYRRSFGRVSRPELDTVFWLVRAALAAGKPQVAEALHQAYRSGSETVKAEQKQSLLVRQSELLDAEVNLARSNTASVKAKLETLIGALFLSESTGGAYLLLTDETISLSLAAAGKPKGPEVISLYRQSRGQRTLVRTGDDNTC